MDLVRCLGPGDFKISLSCLHSYTMNYNQGTAQAERHHHGTNVNAKISLHTAPSTGEIKRPVNAHWTTLYVNFLCGVAHQNSDSYLLDSKDAKCIVVGDIPPGLKPGRVWKREVYPDHTFDQSRNNAVTPVSHLFVENRVLQTNRQHRKCKVGLHSSNGENLISITRPVTRLSVLDVQNPTFFRSVQQSCFPCGQHN